MEFPSWMTVLWQQGLPPIQWGAVLGASLVAAVTDIAYRRIGNWLTGPLLVGGLLFSGLIAGWPGLADASCAMVLLALPYVLLFVWAGGGAGDAKLMAALGAWLGLVNGLAVLVAVSMTGILLALLFALARRRLGAVLRMLATLVIGALAGLLGLVRLRDVRPAVGPVPDAQKMPYGLSIFLGSCLAAAGITWL